MPPPDKRREKLRSAILEVLSRDDYVPVDVLKAEVQANCSFIVAGDLYANVLDELRGEKFIGYELRDHCPIQVVYHLMLKGARALEDAQAESGKFIWEDELADAIHDSGLTLYSYSYEDGPNHCQVVELNDFYYCLDRRDGCILQMSSKDDAVSWAADRFHVDALSPNMGASALPFTIAALKKSERKGG